MQIFSFGFSVKNPMGSARKGGSVNIGIPGGPIVKNYQDGVAIALDYREGASPRRRITTCRVSNIEHSEYSRDYIFSFRYILIHQNSLNF